MTFNVIQASAESTSVLISCRDAV